MDEVKFYRKDVHVEPAWGPDRQLINGGVVKKGVIFIDFSQGNLHLDCKAEPIHLERFNSEYKAFLASEKPKTIVKPVAPVKPAVAVK